MLYNPSKSSPMNVKEVKKTYTNSPRRQNESTTSSTESSQSSLHQQQEHNESASASSAAHRCSPNNSKPPAPTNSLLGMLLPRIVTPDGKEMHNTILSPSPSARFHTSREKGNKNKKEKPHTCLVYLIRHGEASHNVLEKAATRQAQKQAEAQGLSQEEVLACMEQARLAVLEDESLRDASLSEQGRQEALEAKRRLERLVHLQGLAFPSKVLVSPLTRTLETANLIFPNHDTIHVREEIQERQTGKPCDCRQSSSLLSSRKCFKRFEMEALRQSSFMQHEGEDNEQQGAVVTEESSSSDDDDDESDEDNNRCIHPASRRWMSDSRYTGAHANHKESPRRTLSDNPEEEDRASLRKRTRKLLDLLDEPSIAVVTHKGYLRELERGTLGQPDAAEFGNAEIRVYRVHLSAEQGLERAERVV